MKAKGVKVTARGKLVLAATMMVILVITYNGIRSIERHRHDDNHILRNALVACDFLGISPQTTGEIKQLTVKVGQKVKKGDLLFRLDGRDAVTKLKQAAAMLEIAKKELGAATGGARIQEIAAAQTLVQQANAERESRIAERDSVKNTLDALNKTYSRLLAQLRIYRNPLNGRVDEDYAVKLVNLSYSENEINSTQYAVKSQLFHQQFEFKSQLEMQLAELKGRLKSLNASLNASSAAIQNAQSRLSLISDGVSDNDMEILVNKVKAAQIAYENAKLKAADISVRAEGEGTIVKIQAHVGETAIPGSPVLYLADMNNLYINALIDQDSVGKIKLGQSLDIRIDTAGAAIYKGKVSEIGMTTLGIFSNQTDREAKHQGFEQKIPVKITFDRGNIRLIPGMHADIDLK